MNNIPDAGAKKVNIIIVDDEKEIRNFLVKICQLFKNTDTSDFENADKAWEYIKESKVHIVISDINMPGKINGLVLLEKTKREFSDIIFISMSGEEKYKSKAEEKGADVFLLKPFSLQKIIDIIKKYIKRD